MRGMLPITWSIASQQNYTGDDSGVARKVGSRHFGSGSLTHLKSFREVESLLKRKVCFTFV